MNLQQWKHSAILVRVLPFAIFILLTFLQDRFGQAARYWFYLAKTLVGAWFIWQMRVVVREMRWKFTWEAVLAGVVVFIVWVGYNGLFRALGLDPAFAELKVGGGKAWNPFAQFASVWLGWFFVAVRMIGSSLVVPPLEEVFFRSFLYRYVIKKDFEIVPLGRFLWVPFLLTSIVFGFEHREWLAGMVAGCVYQGLVCWKRRLGDAITAHAITNFLLGCWVVGKGAWQFW